MIDTIIGVPISERLLNNYFNALVDSFFKILPIRENEEETLTTYMHSLQLELIGNKRLIKLLNNDARFLRLIAILQFLIDYPETPVPEVKREVFKAIRICNQLKAQYGEAV